MEKEKFSEIDYFNAWVKNLSDLNPLDRYSNANRPSYIEELCQMLFEAGVSLEDAKSLKNNVIIALTTEEGRKGKGKYKGWKETVEKAFETLICSMYIENTDNKTIKRIKTIEKNEYFEENDDIIEYLIKTYGENIPEAILKETHKIGTGLHLKYMHDRFIK